MKLPTTSLYTFPKVFFLSLLVVLQINGASTNSFFVVEESDVCSSVPRESAKISAIPNSLLKFLDKVEFSLASQLLKEHPGTKRDDFKSFCQKIKLKSRYVLWVITPCSNDGSYGAYICIENVETGTFSQPILYELRFLDLAPKPIATYDDFDGDGQKELIIGNVHHMGSDLTSICYWYCKIKDGPCIEPLFALETEGSMWLVGEGPGFIKRSLRIIEKGSVLAVDYEIFKDVDKEAKLFEKGTIIYRRNPKDEKYYPENLNYKGKKDLICSISSIDSKRDYRKWLEEWGPEFWKRGLTGRDCHKKLRLIKDKAK